MRILVVAPHGDDETLAMGGSIARLISEGHDVSVALMTGHGDKPHPIFPRDNFDKVRAEFKKALDVLGVKEVHFRELPAVLMANQAVHEVNAVTKDIIETTKPQRLYVPFAYDLHKDHRELFYSFSVHWRSYLPMGQSIREVYCYETPSETHLATPYLEPGFTPNTYMDISDFLDLKLQAVDCYESQKQMAPLPRSRQALTALAQFRGSQIGVHAAEAFVLVRKIDI